MADGDPEQAETVSGSTSTTEIEVAQDTLERDYAHARRKGPLPNVAVHPSGDIREHLLRRARFSLVGSGQNVRVATPQMRLASISRRSIARFVDLVVEFVPAIVAAAAIPNAAIGFPVFVVLIIAGASQDVLGTARWGQSAGKALLGIRVIDEHSGLPPDLWHAFLRWWIPGLLPPLLVWATWDKHRQGIHDKAAETLVVRT